MEQDIREIYYSEKEDRYRKMIVEDNYDKLPLCQSCYEYIALKR